MKRGRKKKKIRVQKTGNTEASEYINRKIGIMRFKRKEGSREVVKKRNGYARKDKTLLILEERKQIKDSEIFNEYQWWFIHRQIEISYTKYPLTPEQIYFFLGVKKNKEFMAKYKRTKKYWERKMELDVLQKARELGEIKDKDYTAGEIRSGMVNALMELLKKARTPNSEIGMGEARVLEKLVDVLPHIKPELLEEASAFVGPAIENKATDEDLERLNEI